MNAETESYQRNLSIEGRHIQTFDEEKLYACMRKKKIFMNI